jgi:hypothetical protein
VNNDIYSTPLYKNFPQDSGDKETRIEVISMLDDPRARAVRILYKSKGGEATRHLRDTLAAISPIWKIHTIDLK